MSAPEAPEPPNADSIASVALTVRVRRDQHDLLEKIRIDTGERSLSAVVRALIDARPKGKRS